MSAEPQLIELPERLVVGIETRTSNQIELNPETARIPALWRRFFAENVANRVRNRVAPETVLGVYSSYETDHRGAYTLTLGSEVSALDGAMEGLTIVRIPAGAYLAFKSRGVMPAALVHTWGQIWRHFQMGVHRRSYAVDFEIHDLERAFNTPAPSPERVDEVHIHIGVLPPPPPITGDSDPTVIDARSPAAGN